MGHITGKQRADRITSLLAEVNRLPPEKHETVRLPSTKASEALLCHVITMGVDEVLLNHNSHRLRSQLADDPEWEDLSKDPHSEGAQRVIGRHVREARTPEQFARLKDSLQREGQIEAGVMTHEGVLINANTRAVALRELDDPTRHYVRVAVLPESALPEELALLELRLQMQKDLKVEYSLTNELLFIEELSVRRHLTNGFIAQELRIFPESTKKGETEVGLRLQMLDLLRKMQQIPVVPLKLSFFDDPAHRLSYEQLREVLRTYLPLINSDPLSATHYLESFLLSVAVGVTPVHQLRRIDTTFMSDYMVPQLEEDELVGRFATELSTGAPDADQSAPKGFEQLNTGNNESVADVDVKRLIDIVTQRDKTVSVPGSVVKLERDAVTDAVKSAIITGIKEKKRDENAEDKMNAPLEALRASVTQVNRCLETLKPVMGSAALDNALRRSLEAAFKKLRRSVKSLESELVKADIVST